MASYGYEIEFSGFKVRYSYNHSINKIADGTTLFTLYRRDAHDAETGSAICDIKADNVNIENISMLEASSRPSDQVIGEPNHFFEPLDLFLTRINNNPSITINNRLLLNGPEGRNYVAVYRLNYAITISRPNPTLMINQFTAHPQCTFGFMATSVLNNFYKYFQPIVTLSTQINNWENKFLNGKVPYSPEALQAYEDDFLTPSDLELNESWVTLWYVVEFIRLSICFSLNKRITSDDTGKLGNKAYMKILSRTSFRGMIADGVQPAMTVVQIDRLNQYIVNGFDFTHNRNARVPFYKMDKSVCLPPMVNQPYINTALLNNYRNNMTIVALCNSILRHNWETNQFVNPFNTRITMLHPPIGSQAVANTIVQNINTYDFMSPVVYALPTDPMGYFTRYPSPGWDPRFLLEVRYMRKFYLRKTGRDQCLYGELKPFLINMFNRAVGDFYT